MRSSGSIRSVVGCLLAAALLAVVAPESRAQTTSAEGLYKEALSREAALRKELDAHRPPARATSLLRRVRILAGAYEDIARLFPTSGYADDAIWQGAMLAADVHARFGESMDRATALRLLNGLTSRFPSSPFVKQVPQQLARLKDTTGAAAAAATVTPAPVSEPAATPLAASAPVPTETPAAAAPAPTAPAPSPATPGVLRAVRREVLPEAVRITLELDREVQFRDERIGGPPRVYVDLYNTRAAEALKDAAIPFRDGVVRQVRVGRQLDSRTRVVFDLNGAGTYSVYPLYNPYRVVFDFTRPTAAAADADESASREAAVPPAPPSANAAGGFSLSRQLGLRVARIVIDPGHGGHDPGAKANGLTEADLVLDVALRLEKLLQKQKDVEVVLTRRTNVYVPLEERTAIANRSGADLFLSIHVNANAAASARGVETYFLNFAQNKEAEAIAARENAASARSMSELPDIVQAIALNNKLDESRDFATMVQASMYQRLRRVNRSVRNLGVKQAPFMVLIGATMPSILAEIAFMSNRQEAALLKTENYRQQIAEALLAGIMRYQESLKKAPAVARQ